MAYAFGILVGISREGFAPSARSFYVTNLAIRIAKH